MSKVLTVEELNTMAEIVKAVTGEVVSADKNPIEYLQRVRNFLENVIDKMPGRAYWMDANGVTLGCNNNLVIHGGFSSKADIIGKTNYELPWKSNADTYTRNDQQVMSSGKELEFEEIATLPNGTFATSLTHKLPLRDLSGKTIGVLGISLDITERKKLEEKLRVSQAREAAEKSRETSMRAMAGSIAHDMRTPLSAILMAAGVLKNITATHSSLSNGARG